MDKVTCPNCRKHIKFEKHRAEITKTDSSGREKYTLVLASCPACLYHWVLWQETEHTEFLDELYESRITGWLETTTCLRKRYPELSADKVHGVLKSWTKDYRVRNSYKSAG